MNSARKSNGQHTTGKDGAEQSAVPSLPLSEETAGSDQSIGALVRDVTTHLSTLVRAEVELAKSEITSEVKKGVKGSVFFIIALAVLVFSTFFLFFALAEGLAQLGLWRWAAFGIVFLLMLVVAGRYRRRRRQRNPSRRPFPSLEP